MQPLFNVGDSVRHKKTSKLGTIDRIVSVDEVYVKWHSKPIKMNNRPTKCSNLVLVGSLQMKYPFWVARAYVGTSERHYITNNSFLKKYTETYEDQLEARYLLESRDLWFHQLASPTSKWTISRLDKFPTQNGRHVVIFLLLLQLFGLYST